MSKTRITIKEEFEVPGTKVILEKGDQIEIFTEEVLFNEIETTAQNMIQILSTSLEDVRDFDLLSDTRSIGFLFAEELRIASDKLGLTRDVFQAFMQGIENLV